MSTQELEITHDLVAPTFEGPFEAHLTVAAEGAPAVERFRALCPELGVKPVLIALPQGRQPRQLMTSSNHRGPLAQVRAEAQALARALEARGFPVTRLKLEAAPWNPGVPLTDAEAARLPPGHYFELHLKLRLPAGADAGLSARCAVLGAHLSRNAFKRGADGSEERFVTARCRAVGRATAAARGEALRAGLAGYQVGKQVLEYCVLDTNAAVDAGWAEP